MIDLYQDVLTVARSYMGPAAEEYIRRRCNVALGLSNPAELRQEHIDRLAESVGLTAEVYVSQAKVRQFKEDLLRLKSHSY